MPTRLAASRPEFFDGDVRNWRALPSVTLGEIDYSAEASRPAHYHDRACLHLNLRGGYTERIGSRTIECNEHALTFQPAGHEHSYRCHRVPPRVFTVEFDATWLEEMAEYDPATRAGVHADAGALYLAMRVYSEFAVADSTSPLAIEALLLELLGRFGDRRSQRTPRRAPAWLDRIDDMIQRRFTEPLRLEQLAREAGVHPVHLARTFRAYRNVTIGSFVRQLRVTRACSRLADAIPLAQLAAELGFSDQSQFTRRFRHATGSTPGGYRQRVVTRESVSAQRG